METRITATELARRLSDVLNRVKYRGERFVVERNGEPVGPAGPARVFTGKDFVGLLERLPRMGKEFADDLERIQAEQPKAVFPEWPE